MTLRDKIVSVLYILAERQLFFPVNTRQDISRIDQCLVDSFMNNCYLYGYLEQGIISPSEFAIIIEKDLISRVTSI